MNRTTTLSHFNHTLYNKLINVLKLMMHNDVIVSSCTGNASSLTKKINLIESI